MKRNGSVWGWVLVLVALLFLLFLSNFVYPSSHNSIVPFVANTNIDWSEEFNDKCKVFFQVPPKDESSYDRANRVYYWMLREGDTGRLIFDHNVRVIYDSPDALGSGYIHGAVDVYCSENEKLLNTDQLLVSLKSSLNDSNPGITNVIKTQKKIRMWDRDVYVINLSEEFGDFDRYMFATSRRLYLIEKISMSDENQVKETTEAIFEKLKFD